MKKQYIRPNTIIDIITVLENVLQGSGGSTSTPDESINGGGVIGEGEDIPARKRYSGGYVQRNGGWSNSGLW